MTEKGEYTVSSRLGLRRARRTLCQFGTEMAIPILPIA